MMNMFGDRKYLFAGEKINSRGKRGKHLEKENVFFAEVKNNGEGKGGSFVVVCHLSLFVVCCLSVFVVVCGLSLFVV